MSLTIQSSIRVNFSSLKCIQITDSGWIGKCKFKMRKQIHYKTYSLWFFRLTREKIMKERKCDKVFYL